LQIKEDICETNYSLTTEFEKHFLMNEHKLFFGKLLKHFQSILAAVFEF